jgi:hypothetical protein
MVCEANSLLAQYNGDGVWLTTLALIMCAFGIGGTMQNFMPVYDMRRKMLWVWVGFFCGAGLISLTVLYQQLYQRVTAVVDIYYVMQATADCSVLYEARVLFAGLATMGGLNILLLLMGVLCFLFNFIGLLAYMWIPPLVQPEESRRQISDE